ncbi:MAG: GNAT family N-acetyltransferase [Anaerolineae bacterium]|nr:GNAT family N-acetyltransferase [Anaerolineae bacterium]
MVRLIEELSCNAWPALQTTLYDGWVLRFADGYTRRANSVYPLYPSTLNLEAKIDHCERVYARRGLPAIFKMTAAAHPQGLDQALSARGYVKQAPTSVQTLDIPATPDPPPGNDMRVTREPTDAWRAAFCALSHIDDARAATMAHMLASILPETGFIALYQRGELGAVGFGVVERGWLGIFDIVTAAHLRKRGLGRQLMQGLLAWGRSQGAVRAYLQVMLDNAPALHLYAQLGFREVYQYWYRFSDLALKPS